MHKYNFMPAGEFIDYSDAYTKASKQTVDFSPKK